MDDKDTKYVAQCNQVVLRNKNAIITNEIIVEFFVDTSKKWACNLRNKYFFLHVTL